MRHARRTRSLFSPVISGVAEAVEPLRLLLGTLEGHEPRGGPVSRPLFRKADAHHGFPDPLKARFGHRSEAKEPAAKASHLHGFVPVQSLTWSHATRRKSRP